MHPGAEADLKTCCRSPFDLSKLPHSDYEHVLVKDKDMIDLGGQMVEIIDISAHSKCKTSRAVLLFCTALEVYTIFGITPAAMTSISNLPG